MQTTNRAVDLDTLQPHPQNYNRHPAEQVRRLTKSLTKFGQVRSVVVWRMFVLAGHGVVEAARLLNWRTIRADVLPDDYPEHLALAYVAADNELARQGDPDMAQLAAILEQSKAADADLLEAIGYSDKEFEALLAEVGKGAAAGVEDAGAQVDKADELRQKWGTVPGQLWQLGEHRLICGDCTDPAIVARVMGGERAQAIVTDPPYGMNLDASYKNSVDNPAKGIKASRGYAPVIGDNEEYDPRPLLDMYGDVAEQFWWGGDYYADKLPRGGSWLVWDKRATIEELQYSSSEFELCWSKTPHHRQILRVPWFGLIGTEQQDTQKRLHPTQKPLGVIAPLLEYVPVGGIVCDLYGGSGTTIIAAENTGRRARVCEVSAEYCAVILERWAMSTGKTPRLIDAL